jgi:hypothetical protein
MKIVIAHESLGTEWGVETYLLSVIRGLRDRGHQVALLYYRRSDTASALPERAWRSASSVVWTSSSTSSWWGMTRLSHNMGLLEVDRRLLGVGPSSRCCTDTSAIASAG